MAAEAALSDWKFVLRIVKDTYNRATAMISSQNAPIFLGECTEPLKIAGPRLRDPAFRVILVAGKRTHVT